MPDEVVEDLLKFAADHEWAHKNLSVLLEEYPDQWVAVRDGKVIASGPDTDSLRNQLRDPAHTCVEFITRESLEMVV